MGNVNGPALLDPFHTSVGDEESGWLFQVLEFCNQKTRSNAIFICKRYNRILTNDASFRWRLERLHIEDGIYCTAAISKGQSSSISPSSSKASFKELYLGLVQRQMLWYKNGNDSMATSKYCSDDNHDNCDDDDDSKLDEDDVFNIHVSVRFKPVTKNSDMRNNRERKVTLPLHQRLALIRHQNKLNSNRDALNILKEEGEWFKDKWSSHEKENATNNGVSDKECHSAKKDIEDKGIGALSCGVKSIDCSTNKVVIVDSTKGLRNFNFDRVLSDDCKQETVYETSAQTLVQDFINGINACCLVYGVTGSGKTYTMFGPNDNSMLSNNMNKGIVPTACQEIFDVLNYRKKKLNLDIEAQVSLSYIEIFGSEICDLLRHGRPCCQNKAASQRFVLSGAAECEVQNVDDVVKALEEGEKQKRKAATALNERSSRAHSIVMISLNQVCKETGVSHDSTLFLADLGGCEQTKKSDIVSGTSKHFDNLRLEALQNDGQDEESEVSQNNEQSLYSTGFVKSNRMREAVYINLGLMALKSCVEALVSNSKYIPYSDSKLTMMLSTALGGNSKTSVIICAAQDNDLIKETIAALKFGQSCRLVSNSLQTEKDFLRELIEKLDSQIEHCQNEIQRKERWMVREEKRIDTLAEDGTLESNGLGGVEVRKTTVLVGAEKEHHCLSDLLRQRAELTGVSKDYSNHDSHKYGGQVGFGNAHSYGLGKKFNTNDQSDYRFGNVINLNVPSAVKSVLGDSGTWKAGENNLNEVEEATLKSMKKKNRLVYSGLSA